MFPEQMFLLMLHTAAYYSAARELTASKVSEMDVDGICASISVAPEDRDELQRHLQETPAMQMAAASTWLCNITAELNSTTWIGLANDHGPRIRTKRGTRPGSDLKGVLDFRQALRPPGSPKHGPSFV